MHNAIRMSFHDFNKIANAVIYPPNWAALKASVAGKACNLVRVLAMLHHLIGCVSVCKHCSSINTCVKNQNIGRIKSGTSP